MLIFLRIVAVARFVFEHRAEVETLLTEIEALVSHVKADLAPRTP